MSTALDTPAARHLAACDPDWATLISLVGTCALDASTSERSNREPYEALVRSIAYQQLHGKAAETILGRFLARFPDTPFPAPAQVLACDVADMRACGFSASKVAAIREIADKTLVGVVPTRAEATTLSDEELIARITTLRGVGRWTVEMLLIFTLGRPDIWPVDDFGVREGWRAIKGLPEQLKPRDMLILGEALRPYRSTAAWYLWRAADLYKAHLRAQKAT
ncbi:DNA-3-methyladenine glycosylase 2 family protein [Viridibacterium curvum]|uniref:DNA-3-methyladenine glycosylase II n=1 Tax=Viridibacterium curvum TaxID=1101404 RepID=A0ABP9QA09_9RHOO